MRLPCLALVLLILVPSVLAVAELPRYYIDTTMPVQTGSTITVNSGGSFQNALNSAQPGDTIVLQAGATFTGHFNLPNKGVTNKWIIIRTSTPDNQLPPPGIRIDPSYAPLLPKIVTTDSQAAITATNGAHNYRFVGVEVAMSDTPTQRFNYGIFLLGIGNENTVAQVPYNITIDRSYVHGTYNQDETSRCLAFNGNWLAIIDSYVDKCVSTGQDAQAIGGWAGGGPYKIVNNYLAGSHENILFGGADSPITGIVASDIEIRGNYITKDPAWKGVWQEKNLFELKTGQRYLIEGNIFANNWQSAQNGVGIAMKSVNQNGGCPWCGTQDVTFRYNKIYNVGSGFNLAFSPDNTFPTNGMHLVDITHNLVYNINVGQYTGGAYGLQWYGGIDHLTFSHNTIISSTLYNTQSQDNCCSTNAVYKDNIIQMGTYGFTMSGNGGASIVMNAVAPGYVWSNVVFIGGAGAGNPPSTFTPANVAAVGFVDAANNDFRLAPTSPYHNAASDGTDIGADVATINTMTANVIAGIWGGATPPPTPPAVLSATPSGVVPYGTASTTLTATTNKNAICHYSTIANTPYASSTAFTTTGALTHTQTITGLQNGQSYHYYVRCRDATNASLVSLTDYDVSFFLSTTPLVPGVLVWYHFDEGSGTATVDSSGNANTGTVSAAWTTGKNGAGLQFNGAGNTIVDAGTAIPLPTSVTIEAWIYPTTPSVVGSQQIINKGVEYNLRIFSNGSLQGSTGGNVLIDGSFNFSQALNQWHHVAYTFDKTTQTHKLYRDGVQVATATNNGTMTSSASALWIGRNSLSNGQGFDGKIDDVKIYDHAITLAQVIADMNQTLTVPPGDANGDRTINIADVNLVLANLGRTSGFVAGTDVNGDNRIDLFDLVAIGQNWGQSY